MKMAFQSDQTCRIKLKIKQYMGIKICKHKRFHKNAVMKEDISRKIVMNQVIFICSTKNARL